MIPSNIRKRHVEGALDAIDREGTPDGRNSRRFTLHARGRGYPPKYVLSVANQVANGRALKPGEFSGGDETNAFLANLGYQITPSARSSATQVATVLLQTESDYDTATRLRVMRAVLDTVQVRGAGPTLFAFPGGWFKAAGSKPAQSMLRSVTSSVRSLVARHPNCAVSFGLDGSRSSQGTRDQLAVVVDKSGLRAIGRKFHPAPGETIWPPEHWDEGELDYDRIFQFGKKRYFLAVCYDGFGIKHDHLPRPKVDAVLDHVHGFWPGESPVLFARHGFAGASLQWQVPVYGAAVFHGRAIPPTWPSAVRWKGAPRSTMEWKYSDNAMHTPRVVRVQVGDEVAEVRLFRA